MKMKKNGKMSRGGGVGGVKKNGKMSRGGGVGGGRSNPNSVKMPINGKKPKMQNGGGVKKKRPKMQTGGGVGGGKMTAAQKLAKIKKLLGG